MIRPLLESIMQPDPTWWLKPFALSLGLTQDKKLKILLQRAEQPDMEAQIEISPQVTMILKMVAAAVDR